jgi:hypothetical protein
VVPGPLATGQQHPGGAPQLALSAPTVVLEGGASGGDAVGNTAVLLHDKKRQKLLEKGKSRPYHEVLGCGPVSGDGTRQISAASHGWRRLSAKAGLPTRPLLCMQLPCATGWRRTFRKRACRSVSVMCKNSADCRDTCIKAQAQAGAHVGVGGGGRPESSPNRPPQSRTNPARVFHDGTATG